MTKAKVIVADSSGISARQMTDFWRKAADGTIDGLIFQGFLANPRKFTSAGTGLTIVRALNILGDRKVMTAEQAALAWKRSVPENAPIRYSEDTLRQCAELNRTAGTDWRLVYIFGLSLRDQHQLRGDNPNHQPCFYKNWDWWLKKPEDYWATQKPEPGYYLIDFNGRWGSTSWDRQEQKIAKLGPSYERAHKAVISEAVFSSYQTYQEHLLENWYHWGRSLDSYGGRVSVGLFDRDGLNVYGYHPDWDDCDFLRVCLARKFQK